MGICDKKCPFYRDFGWKSIAMCHGNSSNLVLKGHACVYPSAPQALSDCYMKNYFVIPKGDEHNMMNKLLEEMTMEQFADLTLGKLEDVLWLEQGKLSLTQLIMFGDLTEIVRRLIAERAILKARLSHFLSIPHNVHTCSQVGNEGCTVDTNHEACMTCEMWRNS